MLGDAVHDIVSLPPKELRDPVADVAEVNVPVTRVQRVNALSSIRTGPTWQNEIPDGNTTTRAHCRRLGAA